MTKLRWTLLLLALGIGMPAALIVSRATVSLELEKASRHAAVAERVFDEMERSLSDFLVREESRPASDFDLIRRPDRPATPLPATFASAEEPFLLGWFVLPAGVDTPRVLVAAAAGKGRVETALRSVLTMPNARPAQEMTRKESSAGIRDDEAKLPAPGRTRALDTAGARRTDPALTDTDEPSSYEVLQSLNRASSLRSERQSKALGNLSLEAERFAAPSARTGASGLADTPDLLLDALAEGAASDLDEERLSDAEASVRRAAWPPIDPFVGRTTPSGEIVLTRSAWRGARVERQGVVLDRERLADWLGREILRETGLADRAMLDFSPDPMTVSTAPSAYRYVHRFAEPFDDLSARLELEPLPGSDAAASIYTLAALLALALVMGLFALDRMTRVVVEYAQRRSDFVAAVSHELRTPLTAIRMYGEMLRDGLVTSESKRAEYYETITDESERLSRLIDNVLEFSRLEQGRPAPDLVAGGLEDVVREASSKLAAHAQREGFEIELDCPETLPRVGYDRDAITQIVFNLVDNALKYARDGRAQDDRDPPRRDWTERRAARSRPGSWCTRRPARAHLRALLPDGRRADSHRRGHRHRTGAGPRAGPRHGCLRSRRSTAGRRARDHRRDHARNLSPSEDRDRRGPQEDRRSLKTAGA